MTKIPSDVAGILCRQKGWKQEDGDRLSQPERPDDKEQLPAPVNHRINQQYGE